MFSKEKLWQTLFENVARVQTSVSVVAGISLYLGCQNFGGSFGDRMVVSPESTFVLSAIGVKILVISYRSIPKDHVPMHRQNEIEKALPIILGAYPLVAFSIQYALISGIDSVRATYSDNLLDRMLTESILVRFPATLAFRTICRGGGDYAASLISEMSEEARKEGLVSDAVSRTAPLA